ncbi:alpha/beta fold hydrolase [Glycomyces albidus]|uniref:Alpha/beta fold hydrolase n=1 Tax=Glycomyces albidus TaxID=2656774 RepID=A0A6L5G4X9_9ACTN|nr:alpha/beta fold hydrolase [Glycomyces albidus]MQM24681.1 alpha/beta fold hydrolase [Glycomyces albidus]
MRFTPRFLIASAVSALLAATLLAVGPQAASAGHGRGIDWAPCPDVDPAEGVECATIEVPLDYRRPWHGKIEIGLARRQATNPDERIGSIVVNPGGPGVSGVDFVKSVNVLDGEAEERYDLIGFDPRGVNTSTQVLCSEEALIDAWSAPYPESEAEYEALTEANAALTADCREHTGRLFDRVSNLETVEDIERIRRALGEGDLNFLGFSYGTLMGQQYAEKYPRNIRTMVLDGNMDHSLDSASEFMLSQTAVVEETFGEFADWCESTPECALYGEDVETLYADLKARARAGDLIDPYFGDQLDFYTLSGFYTFYSTSKFWWSTLATEYAAMRDGEMLHGALAARQDPVLVENLYTPAWCQDFGYEIDGYEEFAQIAADMAADSPNVEWSPYAGSVTACLGSDIEHRNGFDELDVHRSAPPIVFIGNHYDAATLYEWSVTASEQAGGHLITYEGYEHTAYGFRSCVTEAVNAYFVDGTLPEAGLSCPDEDVPGTMAATAVQQRPAPPIR